MTKMIKYSNNSSIMKTQFVVKNTSVKNNKLLKFKKHKLW